ncbi:MAG: tRNA pseudouridine(38-40) synthase TruA [Solirubrobacterales bacterium]|nr:tRNA pseudouridine(38-40) synthase TruA [Solirubrobacterales bacterium]
MAYDGTGFAGWAVQPGKRTVQGELEEALGQVLGEPTRIVVAGRTDAGVHALGQVASFETDREIPGTLRRALNALTGRDVAVNALAEAPEGFNARFSATSRRYRYRLETASVPSPFERERALHWPYPFDRELADRCAAAVRGVHDFSAFTPTDTRHRHFHREVLDAAWSEGQRPGDSILAFEIEADAFLRGMVRALVGTILEVAGGRRDPADLERLLNGGARAEAGDSVAARGLYLLRVAY